jgi:hypothetical protein
MRFLSSMILMVGLVGAIAPPAMADDGPRADVAGGYSLIYAHDLRTTFPAGWFFSAAVNANNVVAFAAEVSGHYKSASATAGGASASASLKVHTLLAGPRFVAGTGAARFFGQFLVGAALASAGVTASGGGLNTSIGSSETDFCYMPAVGLDIGFNTRTAMRIGAGERWIRLPGGSTSNEFQFVAGLVHRFEK